MPVIIAAAALVGAGGGAGVRMLAKGDPAPQAHDETPPAQNNDHSGEDAAAPTIPRENKGKSGGAKHAKSAEPAAYFKFSRQFVAPIVNDAEPAALMILDVMIELSPESGESIYADEPKLRDAVLKALLAQSANGDLRSMLTSPDRLEATREAILENVRTIIGDDAKAILLMDVGYQPF